MESDVLDDLISPLVIPKVLQQILDFLTIPELKTSRIVCSQFNQEACTLLRKKDRVLFNSLDKVGNFTSVYATTGNFPYKSFLFSSELLESLRNPCWNDYEKKKLIFDNFCILFGCYVAVAHFNFSSCEREIKSNDRLVKLLREILLVQFPNLESLSLLLEGGAYGKVFESEDRTLTRLRNFCINISGYEYKYDLQGFISSVLEKCPNLEVISCKLPSGKSESRGGDDNEGASVLQPNLKLSQSILQSILELDMRNCTKKASDIEMLLKLNEVQLKLIVDGDLKLRRCYLELDSSTNLETLCQFICKHKNQLEFLYLELPVTFNSFNTSENIRLPCVIPYLKTLSLQNYKGSLRFLNKCQVVRTVVLKNVSLSGLGKQDWSSDSVRCFRIQDGKRLCELPKCLAIWFPNLTSLFLGNTDDETVRCVFTNMKSLRDITLIGCGITDGGICGESDKILKLLIESMANDVNSKASLDLWEYQPRFPSICDLKYLQVCKIEANFISDACIVFGIALCKGLKKLNLFSRLELITTFGVTLLSELQDLNEVRIFIRNFGWADLEKLRILANAQE